MARRQTGVTLIELMIVVVIIAILAAIAYPSYRDQVRRSNRTEAKVALEQTAQALEKCFTRYMSYANFDDCPAAAQFEDGGSFDTPDGNYRITGDIDDATPTEFELTATPLGGQASDARCMNFTFNEAGVRDVSVAGARNECW